MCSNYLKIFCLRCVFNASQECHLPDSATKVNKKNVLPWLRIHPHTQLRPFACHRTVLALWKYLYEIQATSRHDKIGHYLIDLGRMADCRLLVHISLCRKAWIGADWTMNDIPYRYFCLKPHLTAFAPLCRITWIRARPAACGLLKSPTQAFATQQRGIICQAGGSRADAWIVHWHTSAFGAGGRSSSNRNTGFLWVFSVLDAKLEWTDFHEHLHKIEVRCQQD